MTARTLKFDRRRSAGSDKLNQSAQRRQSIDVEAGTYPTIATIAGTKIGRSKPFVDKHVLAVPHLRPSAVAFVKALIDMGATPAKVTVFVKPYTYPEGARVEAKLRRLGVAVVPLERKRKELAKIKARLEGTGERAVVYDDGAEILPEILADNAFAAMTIGGEEQTTRGRNKLRALRLERPVLSLPCSEFKKTFECGSVAKAGVEALDWHLGTFVAGHTMAVLGCAGVIGSAFAKEAAVRGLRVRGFDSASKDRYFALKSHSFMTVCPTRAQALNGADIVIGATGCTSLPAEDLPFLKDGVVLGSMSSGQVEFPLDEIRNAAIRTAPFRLAGDREAHGDTYTMRWGRTITVLDGGRPLNLGVAAGPEEACFDLVMAVLLMGLAEVAAASFEGQAGLLDVFDDLIQRHDLATAYMSLHAHEEAA